MTLFWRILLGEKKLIFTAVFNVQMCCFAFNFSTYKKKFTYDVLSGIATCLLDGTVFEIVKGLEDIQQLSERNLLNKRMKIVNSQKGMSATTAFYPGFYPPVHKL